MAASLPDGVLVRVEAVVWRCEGCEGGEGVEEEKEGRRWTGKRSSLHVQSHSEWAPANIGPYSQAYTVRTKGLERERKREREMPKTHEHRYIK